jgi:hypothetical protein
MAVIQQREKIILINRGPRWATDPSPGLSAQRQASVNCPFNPKVLAIIP